MTEGKFESLHFTELDSAEMISASKTFYQKMKQRRSVREFSNRPVPIEVIKNAILAAGTAPSGANQQPWHFAVVSNPETKKKIREAAEEEERTFYQDRAPAEWLKVLEPLGTDANKPFLEIAPYLIVIFLKKSSAGPQGVEQKNYYTNESVGIATGLLITSLHLSGLATLTHTPSPMNFLTRTLGRPNSERAFLIVVTGYPASNVKVPRIHKYQLDQLASFE